MTAMDAPASNGQVRPDLAYMIGAAGAVAAVHLVWWLFSDNIVLAGRLFDGDSYAHLLRAERLYETGAWFDISMPRANAPYGGALHWTRLFDMILLGLAAPLVPLLGFKTALFWAGALVSPLLHIVSAVVLAWAVRPVLGSAAAGLAGGMTALQFGILAYATPGHADHHLLYSLLTSFLLGLTLRSLTASGDGGKTTLALGGVMAVSLWAGPEMLVTIALCLSVLAAPWLSGEPGAITRNLTILLAFAFGIVGVMIVERGPGGFSAVEYDRVSLVHLILALLLVSFWAVVHALRRLERLRTISVRLAAGLLGVSGIAIAMRFLFPGFFLGPLAEVDPGLRDLMHQITELEPVGGPARFLIYLGGAVFALPWAAWRMKTAWPTPQRWAWALISGALIIFVMTAANWLRAAPYAGLLLAVVLADLLCHLDKRMSARDVGTARRLMKLLVLPLVAVGPLAAGTVLTAASAGGAASPACPLNTMAAALDTVIPDPRPLIILASADDGPELLYRTHHHVTATQHHRNGAGILFNVEVLGSVNESAARRRIDERRVDLVLLCRHAGGSRFFQGRDDGAILYRRLTTGMPPGWLRPVSLPGTLGESYKLYRVTKGSSQ